MSPAVISAIASGIALVLSAVFTGLVQLQHNRAYHGGQDQDPPPPAAGQQHRAGQ